MRVGELVHFNVAHLAADARGVGDVLPYVLPLVFRNRAEDRAHGKFCISTEDPFHCGLELAQITYGALKSEILLARKWRVRGRFNQMRRAIKRSQKRLLLADVVRQQSEG